MQFDFGALKAIRHMLLKAVQRKGLDVKQVYLSVPPAPEIPAILVEIEEIWTSMVPLPGDVMAKIKLKASYWARQGQSRESIMLAGMLRREVDGNRVALEDGRTGVFRFVNSMTDLPHANRPSAVHHFFDVSIRNAAHG